ncbi:hypothetical protein ACH5RR_020535 [Cinchona calisaya]|uniref:Late embryogenesis abundant protein LEA-2 subgroup domain-containing protein n=1 Tax=Cinchona calisaya TaxID=153742 RepID=A0ABD2ZGI7_9GENT
MAGLAANKTKGGQALPPAGSRLQKNLSRRVSFNESTVKPSPQSSIDIERQRNNPPPHRPSCCNACCACISLTIGTLFFIILVVGAVFFSFFQSNMPDFYFKSLNVTNLEISTTNSDTTFLTADIKVGLNATNKNAKMPVDYTSMNARLSSEDIYIGTFHLPGMEQEPHNSKELKLQTRLKNVPVADADAKEIKKKWQNHELLVDLTLDVDKYDDDDFILEKA